MSGKNLYLGKRWFAGQVARAGESGIVAPSYINADENAILGGRFVAMGDAVQTCRNVSAASDKILGVSMVIGIFHEFKPNRNLSVMTLPHGSEIVVQMAEGSELKIGDAVTVVVKGKDAGTASHNGDIKTHFYVTDVNGSLAKIMRSEVNQVDGTGA
ncbi:structural cement protein Gp24 [Xenorhabdus griffiniae]|uniref:Uncharacterized protein n=1 Tax=Xenorhabdus griffiniae TaxID=351672 RepID=A0ABY9XEA8_9GAMM|nr:hypothetical protein [Xenorhabdus griffiniae]MBD1228377.1 hypothetical protein [Xenorhabdus griffiniae]MBE8587970.1 hypothetical protein [Xenorhabdus griffiniae]WMV71240.1 hypothetical protein QL128_13735 [Xenorhabdus griffiniae]WNH00916.1 hypothetical protein QL112_013740 [Xenorhabdus griffiniae]